MLKKVFQIQILLALVLYPAALFAQHSSNNYTIEESFIGPGGLLDATSSSYNLRASLGDTGVGNSGSASYQIYGGYTTTSQEYLEMYVPATIVDMGVLDASTTATGSATFYLRSYLTHGYVITTASQPPTSSNGDVIEGMATRAAPTTGQEEFGINLVANTILGGFGNNPDQIPDNTFSFGYAAADYDTQNEFKYAVGDTIAQSDSSSGVTEYTISYVMNIEPLTPAGDYIMAHYVVATSTF